MKTSYDIETIIAQLPDPHSCECDYWNYEILNTSDAAVRCGLPEDEDVTQIKVLTFKRQVRYSGGRLRGYEWVLVD